MFIEPITRQTFKYNTPLSYVKNPQKDTLLDPNIDEQYVITPKPVLRVTPTLFEPKQFQPAISRILSLHRKLEFIPMLKEPFSGIVFFFWKHSAFRLKLLEKAISFDFICTPETLSKVFYSNSNRNSFNQKNVSMVGSHDHFLKNARLSAPDWLANAFIAIFGFPCFNLTQTVILFSIFLFLEIFVTILFKFCISQK